MGYASDRTFDRGKKYQQLGRVDGMRQNGDRVSATVRGNEDYSTSIRATATSLTFSCTFPVGQDGTFCKHCVALGLEWLELGTSGDNDDAVRDFLESLDKQSLLGILVELAAEDANLLRKLEIRSAAGRSPSRLDKLIDRSLKSRTFVDYYRMPTYAKGATRGGAYHGRMR